MSSNQNLYITTFNNLFTSFLNDLLILFPNDSTLKMCITMAPIMLVTDSLYIAREFKNAIEPFKEKIIKKDEEYFLNSEFLENFGDDHYIMNEINRVINVWKNPNTTQENKKIIWDYIIKLVKIVNKILL